MKSAWRQPDRRCNIDSAVPVKISDRSKLRRITDAVPLMWSQAAVGIDKKHRHVVRRVVQHHNVGRSISIDISRMDVVADPEIFQHT